MLDRVRPGVRVPCCCQACRVDRVRAVRCSDVPVVLSKIRVPRVLGMGPMVSRKPARVSETRYALFTVRGKMTGPTVKVVATTWVPSVFDSQRFALFSSPVPFICSSVKRQSCSTALVLPLSEEISKFVPDTLAVTVEPGNTPSRAVVTAAAN